MILVQLQDLIAINTHHVLADGKTLSVDPAEEIVNFCKPDAPVRLEKPPHGTRELQKKIVKNK